MFLLDFARFLGAVLISFDGMRPDDVYVKWAVVARQEFLV